MKVRMLISIAGLPMPRYGITGVYSLAAGDELELDGELAAKWIASGHAEAVEAQEEEAKPRRKRKE